MKLVYKYPTISYCIYVYVYTYSYLPNNILSCKGSKGWDDFSKCFWFEEVLSLLLAFLFSCILYTTWNSS